MNSIGFVEIIVVLLLFWILLGPEKLGLFARSAGRMYRQISGMERDYPLGSVRSPSKSEKIRASAERLGIDTSGLNEKEMSAKIIKEVEFEKK